jgi:hypothetical protein
VFGRAAVSLTALSIALLASSPAEAATGADASLSASPSAKAWCAIVIKINTHYGAMKNKHYLPPNQVPVKSQKAIVSAGVAQRAQILAVTPPEIKKAMTDELTYYARLKARGYTNPASLTPFTIAEAGQLLNFQHIKCSITGP